MKTYFDMTRQDFLKLEYKHWHDEVICDSIVIIPHDINRMDVLKYNIQKRLSQLLPSVFRKPEIYDVDGMHDSGFRLISYALVVGNVPIYLAGAGDVLHIDGIGGYGHNWMERKYGVPTEISVAGWCMDCLPKSGLLRLWCKDKILVTSSLSSQEIYHVN